jgi:hypothetical protein
LSGVVLDFAFLGVRVGVAENLVKGIQIGKRAEVGQQSWSVPLKNWTGNKLGRLVKCLKGK